MAITIGIPQPGDGAGTETRSGKGISRIYGYRFDDDWLAELPAIGTAGEVGSKEAGLYLLERSYSTNDGGGIYWRIELKYGPGQPVVITSSGDTIWSWGGSSDTIPLELHPDYLTYWNYNLYALKTTTTIPSWALTATDTDDADGIYYEWAKTSPGSDWKKIVTMKKIGVDSYLLARDVVNEEKFYYTRDSASSHKGDIGYLVTPSETFGVSIGTWLITDSTIQQNGKYWTVRNTYLNSGPKNWDTEIYSAP